MADTEENCEWMVIRTRGQVLITVVDDDEDGDVVFYEMSPEGARLLAEDIQLKAMQTEDDE